MKRPEQLKRDKIIVDLYRQGKSLRWIGRKYNLAHGSVRYLLIKYNVKRRLGLTKRQTERCRKLYFKTRSIPKVANTTGHSAIQIELAFKKVRISTLFYSTIEKRERRKQLVNRYLRKRFKIDPHFRMRRYLNNRLRYALKGNHKSQSIVKLLGCSIPELKQHLESRFKDGMTWDNYGKWHIDHILPCASFDLSRPEQQSKCFNHQNLQPLWAYENLKKSDKFFK